LFQLLSINSFDNHWLHQDNPFKLIHISLILESGNHQNETEVKNNHALDTMNLFEKANCSKNIEVTPKNLFDHGWWWPPF
jgi:hypothetical protein